VGGYLPWKVQSDCLFGSSLEPRLDWPLTTIVYNQVVFRESAQAGINVGVSGTSAAPREAQLHGYQNAMWAGSALDVW